ncbi:MAG: hypothetical protein ABJB47_11330 [Actinomycetota bacterium]
MAGTVRQIALPPGARALSTLPRIGYTDAFLAETGPVPGRTGEQWARAVLEDAPPRTRTALTRGWFALGLRLGSPRSGQLVLGWQIRHATPDAVLLGATGRFGLSGELLFERQQDALLFATFVQLEHRVARIVWARTEARHRQVVQSLLEHASKPARLQPRP